MSHFQHVPAVNSATLSAIFDDMQTDWVTWSHSDKDGIAVDLSYEWGWWYFRSYVSDELGSQVIVVRVQASSLSTLRRRVNRLKESYQFPHTLFIDQFLSRAFGAFHMYDVDANLSWVRDIY